jgi:hypothetical protein
MASEAILVGRRRYALTGWIAGDALPAREGVYERREPAGPYACWCGGGWRADASSPAEAVVQTAASDFPASPWRGLAEAPDSVCLTCSGHGVLDAGFDAASGRDLIAECPDC